VFILDDAFGSGNKEENAVVPPQSASLLRNGAAVVARETASTASGSAISGWRRRFFSRLSPRFCPSCNKIHWLRREEYYCNKCGMRLIPTHAEQRYSSLLQTETARFRAIIISDLDKINANTVAELALWGEKREAEARAMVESMMTRTTQHFADAVQRTTAELGVALNCKKAAAIERYGKSIEQISNENLADVKQCFKSELRDHGRALMSTSTSELKRALDESASGLLTEFSETTRTTLNTSLSKLQQEATTTTSNALTKFQEETTKRLGTVAATANKAIDETSAAIDHDIADLRKTVAEHILKLRDQLRCEEDRVLQRTTELKATVEDALGNIRNKALNAISKQTKTLTDLEKKTRHVEENAEALDLRRVNIEKQVSSLAENLSKIEGINNASAERAEHLTKQLGHSLDIIGERASTMRTFLADTDEQNNRLRARISALLEDYEAEIASAKDKLVTPPIDEMKDEIVKRGHDKMTAELEYRLVDLRQQLKEKENSILRQAEASERDMARESLLLVQSHRSTQYVKKKEMDDLKRQNTKKGIERLQCDTCGKRLRYISQYNRWYCDSCARYAPKGIERKLEREPESELRRWYNDVWKQPVENS